MTQVGRQVDRQLGRQVDRGKQVDRQVGGRTFVSMGERRSELNACNDDKVSDSEMTQSVEAFYLL